MPDSDEQTKTDYSGFIIFLLLVPVFLLFKYFGKVNLALPACTYLGMVLVAVRIRWSLRRYVWFWFTIALIFLIQALLVILVPFPHIKVTRISILPIGVADFLLILGAINLVEKFAVNTKMKNECAK
jgi:hypothetical protein